MKTKIFTFIALLLIAAGNFCSCGKNDPKEQVCNFDNPLTDLPWLKAIVGEIQEVNPLSATIYQCNYGNGEIGFLIDRDYMKPFYNCKGEVLCIMDGIAGETCSELNIDFENKKLIWEMQPDPPLSVDNLYAQPLPIIQKCVQGKWKLHKIWDGTNHFYSNTFVDISENMVIVSGDENINYTFSYIWKEMEVSPPYPNMPSYTTFVMWNDEQNKGEWSFYNLLNDFLEVNKYDQSGVYTLIRIRQ